MRFAAPLALAAILLAPLALLIFAIFERRAKERLARAGDIELLSAMAGIGPDRGSGKRWVQASLLAGALALIAVALARPQFGARTELRKARGMDVVLALDLSKSMLAQDVSPSRLGRARLEIEALLGQLRGDRVGLVAFTSVAVPLCPLTIDHAALELQLRDARPEDLPRGGTSLAEAIRASKKLLDQSRYPQAGKAIVVITDGEENEGDPQEAAKEAKDAGIEVHVVGVGSKAGEPIPIPGGYLKDSRGQTVISRLNESMLEAIATAGGGVSALPGSSGGLDLGPVRARLRQLQKAELEQREVRIYEERYRWALVPAFLLLLGATLARPRRRIRAVQASLQSVQPLVLLVACAPLLLGAGPLEREHPAVARGNQSLIEGDTEAALKAYEQAEAELRTDPALAFNRGLANAAAGELDQAIEHYKSALAGAEDPSLRAQAAFALGNAYRSLKKYDEAIGAYRQSLLDDPRQQAARRNLELTSAMKRIHDLQPKQPGEENEPGDQPNQNDGGVSDASPPDGGAGGDGGGEDGGGGADGGSGQDGGGSSSGEDGGGSGQDGSSSSAGQDGGVSPDAGGGSQAQPEQEQEQDLDQQDVRQILDSLKAQEKAIKNRRLLEKVPRGNVEKDW